MAMGADGAGSLAGEDVEDDVGGVDAVGERLGAGRLDRCQAVGEHHGQDVDHLAVAVCGAGEPAPDALDRRGEDPVLERRAVAQRPRLARQHWHVVPGVVHGLAAAEGAVMLAWRITTRSA